MKNANAAERRRFSRISFDAEATLTQDGQEYSAQLLDISLNGVLLTTPTNYGLRVDLPCMVKVRLAANAIITMQVALIHSSSEVLGFHCTSIDMDSITHLRRLLEMNLDDPAASERVLTELLKRHETA